MNRQVVACSALLASFFAASVVSAATPASGTITMTDGLASPTLNYSSGPLPVANASPQINERDDYDCDELNPCDDYALTINLPANFRATHPAWRIRIVTAAVPVAADIDFQVRNADGSLVGVVRDNPPAQPTFLYQPKGGTEVLHLQIVPGTPVPDATAAITLYEDPAFLGGAPVQVLSGGPNFRSYPYTTGGASEPTMGVNVGTNAAYYINGLTIVKGVWNASGDINYSSLGNGGALESLDPFLTVDQFRFDDGKPETAANRFDGPANNRVWIAHLLGGTSYIAYSDDGTTWTRSITGPGQIHGVDNESIVLGPYPAVKPLTAAAGSYEHAMYYCSHEAVNAFCSRSDDGGATFGPSRPIFPADASCSNHGHVKVGHDGTVFVPMNNTCQGTEGVSISTDAGETWHYIAVPGTVNGRWDPSVAMANDGKTVWFGYAEQGDDRPMIVKGIIDKSNASAPTINWQLPATDVGVPAGLKNIAFATVVAGDADRAAFAFHGTNQAGDSGTVATFSGATWFLYVATTFDGGKTWNLRNATPNDPTQRNDICDQGTNCATTGNHRNLLDFMDMDIDGEGRLVLIMADGCTGGCVTGAANYSAQGTFVRQVDGKRMFAAFDPSETLEPGTPTLAGSRNATGVTLTWSAVSPGTGGTLSGYEVERSIDGAAFAKISQTLQLSYNDSTATDPAANYAYRIRAVNSGGNFSPYSGTVTLNAASGTDSACTLPGIVVATDGAGDQMSPGTAAHDIQFVAVAEPYTTDADKSLTFTMKVADLGSLPPNTSWKIRFTVKDTAGIDRILYVEMHTKDPLTALTPEFGYGWQDGTTDTGEGDAGVVSGSFTANGTIRIKFNIANPLSFSALGGTTATFTAKIEPGTLVGSSLGLTQLLVGAQPGGTGGGLLREIDSTAAGDNYSVKGNRACLPNNLPTATLALVRTYDAVPGSSIKADFNATGSSDSDGSIASYTFTFGDGSAPETNTTGLATHTFNGSGGQAFPVRVAVTDNRGGVSTPSTLVQILIPEVQNSAPVANDRSGSTAKNTSGLFTLSGSDADGDTLSYAISTAPTQGTVTLSGSAATYTPATDYVGSDSFTFTVNDGKATSVPATVSISVVDQQGGGSGTTINAQLALSSGGQPIDPAARYQAPLSVTLDASGTTVSGSQPASYIFVLGDGNSMSQDCSVITSCAVLSYVYDFAGTFNSYVIVTDARGNNGVSAQKSVTTVVSVQVDPNSGNTVAKLTLQDAQGNRTSSIRGEAPLSVTMDASGSVARQGRSIVKYTFDFGDGYVVDGGSPTATHVYLTPGSYQPTLTVVDSDQQTSTAKAAVAVNSTPVQPGQPGQTVQLTPRSRGGAMGQGVLLMLAVFGLFRRRRL